LKCGPFSLITDAFECPYPFLAGVLGISRRQSVWWCRETYGRSADKFSRFVQRPGSSQIIQSSSPQECRLFVARWIILPRFAREGLDKWFFFAACPSQDLNNADPVHFPAARQRSCESIEQTASLAVRWSLLLETCA